MGTLEGVQMSPPSVERLISKVAVHGKYSTKSDSKLKDLGLTKYVKTSDGSYARTVGKGGPTLMIRTSAGSIEISGL